MKLFFLVILFLGSNLIAQNSCLFVSPEEVKVGEKNLIEFIHTHKQAIKEVKSISGFPSDVDMIQEHLDKSLSQNNFSINSLKEANLANVDLEGHDLRYLNLKEVDLSGAILKKTNLKYVNMKEANLTNANLIESNLMNANLKEATVTNAMFDNAVLDGADLSETIGLTSAQILSAKTWINAELPEDIQKQTGKN